MAEATLEHIDVGTNIAGTYELTGLIGKGGAGAVWSARHLRLPGKQVAVKFLLGSTELGTESYARFRHEAEIASRLGHPNIVEVLDFNELPGGTPYMVMELLKGESLRDRVQRGPLPFPTAMSIARQIGSALHAAHKQQIVHRDLKPANVFLCPYDADGVLRDHVKVLDFGISKIRDSESVRTRADALMGTPRYMAPEQALGKNDVVDQRTDEFALGAIVYEMLSGRPAFTGEGVAEILMQVMHSKPEPLAELAPDLAPHVVAAIDRALEKDATRRFPDVASFIAALTGSTLESFEPQPATGTATRAATAMREVSPRTGKVEPASEERVPAGILFGDMKGSTEEAELDERATVDKLRQYERIINQTATGFGPNFYKVKTEGDGFMATFATAHAMVECGFAVQQEFRRRGWQVRLGGHYGEVYRNQSGDTVGADVNRAARIQSAADAARGQFLVSDAVKAIVRNRLRDVRFEAHPAVAAKGVSEALVVFEVLPAAGEQFAVKEDRSPDTVTEPPEPHPGSAPHAAQRSSRRWSIWVASTAALVAVVAASAFIYDHFPAYVHRASLSRAKLTPIVAPRTVVPEDSGMIAVMEFENQRSDDVKDDWFCKALQTAFNTELSKIPQISVVAPEIIQRTAKESGIDAMTAARQLGATRFVTGSFAVMGTTLRIDARIVDTAHGLQEAAENVEGEQGEFFSLQKKLTLATMDHFKVRLTAAEQATLNKPTNARLDKYRMLLGAEGVTENAAPPSATPAGPQALGSRYCPSLVSWLGTSTAFAQDPPGNIEAAVRKVLDEYRIAHETGDLDRLASLYVAFPASQRESLSAYLKGIKQLHVELANVKIQPREHDVAVSYTRRDNFVDKETGEPVSLEVRVTKFLVPDGDTWKFSEGS